MTASKGGRPKGGPWAKLLYLWLGPSRSRCIGNRPHIPKPSLFGYDVCARCGRGGPLDPFNSP